MKVLMISIDKGLLGQGQLGDVVERHKKYGDYAGQLDIIVFSKKGFAINKISEKVTAYPTNSVNKFKYFFDAVRIGRNLFATTKYDLVVTQEPFITGLVGVKLKKKFGAKLLVHFHGDFGGRQLLFAKIFVLPWANAIRVMSAGQKEKLIKTGIKEDKVRIISTPINLDRCFNKKSEIRGQNENVVLHIGRDDEVKDYDTLVKVFKIVKEKFPLVTLVQIGAQKKLEKAKIKNGFTDFIMQGRKDYDDVIDWIVASGILISSSTSESFGKVLVEANACGKPVVSTATTGAKEIIQDGYNGYLVPIGDAQALADKILYLLNNPGIAKQMGENGRKLVKEKFSDNTEKIINLWRELAN